MMPPSMTSTSIWRCSTRRSNWIWRVGHTSGHCDRWQRESFPEGRIFRCAICGGSPVMAKLTPETAAAGVAKMALMAFFPGDPDIRAALVSVFMDLVDTEEQLDWLVNRALRRSWKVP